MNQKFGYYFKEGATASKGVFRRFTNFLKYDIIVVLSMLAVLIPPLALTMKTAMAKQQKEEREIGVLSSMSAMNDGKTFWRLLCTIIVCSLLILASLVVGSFILCIVHAITIPFCITDTQFYYTIIIPLVIICAAILLFFRYALAPLAYISYNHPELKVTQAITLSFTIMKKGGKLKVLVFDLLSGIAEVLFLSIAASVIVGVSLNERLLPEAKTILVPLLVLVFVIAHLFYHPFINTIKSVGLYTLYEDMLASEYHPNSISGFTIEKIKYYENTKIGKVSKKNVEKEIETIYEPSNPVKPVIQDESTIDDYLKPLNKTIKPVTFEDKKIAEEEKEYFQNDAVDELTDSSVREESYEEVEATEAPEVEEAMVEEEPEIVEEAIVEEEPEAIEEADTNSDEVDEFEEYIQNLSSKEEGAK